MTPSVIDGTLPLLMLCLILFQLSKSSSFASPPIQSLIIFGLLLHLAVSIRHPPMPLLRPLLSTPRLVLHPPVSGNLFGNFNSMISFVCFYGKLLGIYFRPRSVSVNYFPFLIPCALFVRSQLIHWLISSLTVSLLGSFGVSPSGHLIPLVFVSLLCWIGLHRLSLWFVLLVFL